MRKVALLIMIAMLIASTPAMALVHSTMDGVVADAKGTDIAPIRDAGLIIGGVHKGLHYTYDEVTKPLSPILDPVHRGVGFIMDSTKLVINKVWGVFGHLNPMPESKGS